MGMGGPKSNTKDLLQDDYCDNNKNYCVMWFNCERPATLDNEQTPRHIGDINDCKSNKQSKQWVVTVMLAMV